MIRPLARWTRVSPRERRTIAIGLILLLVAAVIRSAPHALREIGLLRANATLATETLARSKTILAESPSARESLAVRAHAIVELAPKLLAGASPAEASAELAGLVSGAASLRHVRIIQQETHPDSSASMFTRISMRLSAEGDAVGITEWVADLEEGTRLLTVRSLAISAPEPAASAAQPERLHADLVVDGWSALRSTK